MAKSTTKRQGKPGKPRPDFPLYAHRNGQWAKKIRGRTHFFGVWDAPDDALEKYLDQRDELLAGRTPRPTADGFTVRDLCNHFMTAKAGQRDAGDITPRTFADYLASCKLIVDSFGEKRLVDDLKPSDFEQLRAALAKTRNPNTLGNEVQRIRGAFKYGYDADMIERPVKFGPTFKRPAKRVLRAVKQSKDKRQFTATEIRDILGIATVPMRAMVLTAGILSVLNLSCNSQDDALSPHAVAQVEKKTMKNSTESDVLERDVATLKEKAADQAHAMMDVDYHFTNLWFAGKAENWPLAEFYWSETRSHMRWAVRIIPVRKDNAEREIKLKDILEAIENSPLTQLKEAIDAKDAAKFESAYRYTVESCYTCHKASDKPYLRPQIPERPATSIINFDPNATWPK